MRQRQRASLLQLFTLLLSAASGKCGTRRVWAEPHGTVRVHGRSVTIPVELQLTATHQGRDEAVRKAQSWAAPDGIVLWTLANFGWRNFAFNWVTAVRLAGIEHFFVATLDETLYRELLEHAIPAVHLDSPVGAESLEWGTAAFKERGREKIRFIHAMLHAGLSPLFSDLDVVWLRDPLPFVRGLPEPNVLVSTDGWVVPPAGEGLDDCGTLLGTERTVDAHETYVGMMNVGLHFLRPSAIILPKAWLIEMTVTGEMEQHCWNNVLLRSMQQMRKDPYCRAMQGRVLVGLLPATLFENGLSFFVQQAPRNLDVVPYAVHESYISGTHDKIFHLREALLWHMDGPERFSPHIRLLSVELDLSPELLRRARPPPGIDHDVSAQEAAGHMALAREQYRQVLASAALAKALRRTLVMPQLWCGLENLWAAHRGRVWHGIEYEQPAPCPMSQLFHPELWQRDGAGPGHLPPIVESSYLRNLHARIQPGESLRVEPCDAEPLEGCCSLPDGGCGARDGVLSIRPGANQTDILHLLQAAKHVRLLTVTRILNFWPLHFADDDTAMHAAFDKARRGFCCTADGGVLRARLGDAEPPSPAGGPAPLEARSLDLDEREPLSK